MSAPAIIAPLARPDHLGATYPQWLTEQILGSPDPVQAAAEAVMGQEVAMSIETKGTFDPILTREERAAAAAHVARTVMFDEAARLRASTIDSLDLLSPNDRAVTAILETPMHKRPIWGNFTPDQRLDYWRTQESTTPSASFVELTAQNSTLGLLDARDRLATAALGTQVVVRKPISNHSQGRARWGSSILAQRRGTDTGEQPQVRQEASKDTPAAKAAPAPSKKIEVPELVASLLTPKQWRKIRAAEAAGKELSPWAVLSKGQLRRQARGTAAEARADQRRADNVAATEDQRLYAEAQQRARASQQRRQLERDGRLEPTFDSFTVPGSSLRMM